RSSRSTMVSPLLRNAISCSLRATVSVLKYVVSKMVSSGQNDRMVPVRSVVPSFCSGPGSELTYFCVQITPPRWISTSRRLDRAFTTDTPTPCKPPDTAYDLLSNLPPACSTVSATSTPGFFIVGCSSTGKPRPSSSTRTPPSASSVTSTRVAYPAIASSTALSTTSQIKWCRPRSPVEPMYMPG